MSFQLPIEYCPDKKKIFDNLYTDLELLKGESKGMYEYLMQPSTTLGERIKSDEIYECEGPFDIEKIVQKVDGLVTKIGGAAESIDSLIIVLK